MISARRRKNTVRESRMEMDSETWLMVLTMGMVMTMIMIMLMVQVMRESRMEMVSKILQKINSKIRRRMMENKWNDQEMMERSKKAQITFSPLSEGR